MIAPAPIVAIATALVGSPTQVECIPARTMDGDSGRVYFRDAVPDHLISLDTGVCERLSHPLLGIDALDYLVLEHEALHIALATTDECLVEQAALANIWQTVRRFRLPARLARFVLANVAIADRDRLGPQYHPDPLTGACT